MINFMNDSKDYLLKKTFWTVISLIISVITIVTGFVYYKADDATKEVRFFRSEVYQEVIRTNRTIGDLDLKIMVIQRDVAWMKELFVKQLADIEVE